jgi:putative redox protein
VTVVEAKLQWDRKMGFTASAASGHTVKIDVSTEVGGADSGPRPTELLLFGLGGCSGYDIVAILQKMRVDLEDFAIEITAQRAPEHPRKFTAIDIVYRLAGKDIDPVKANRAAELSLTKYCSVAATLNAEITYRVVISERMDA